jgi:hypothetical protein
MVVMLLGGPVLAAWWWMGQLISLPATIGLTLAVAWIAIVAATCEASFRVGHCLAATFGILGGVVWRWYNDISHYSPFDLDTYALMNGALLAVGAYWLLMFVLIRSGQRTAPH